MKLRLRLLSLCLAVLLFCGTMPVFAEDASGTCGDNLTWTLTGDTLTISGTGDMFDFNTTGHPKIAEWKPIRTLVIADGVTSIGAWAFNGCGDLSSVTIPGSVKSIGNYAFYNCKAIESLSLPQGVEHIGERAFLFCNALSSLTLPDSITQMDYGAFWGCSALTSFTFPKNLKTIADNLLYNCTGITELVIPPYIESIGAYAFSGCPLNAVYFNAENCTTTATAVKDAPIQVPKKTDFSFYIGESVRGLPSILCYGGGNPYKVCAASWEDYLRVRMSNTFVGNDGYQLYIGGELIENLVLPDTVTEIGGDQFYNCDSLRSVTFGDGIQLIGSYSFANCDNLHIVTIETVEPIEICDYAFDETTVMQINYAGTQADFLHIRFGGAVFYVSNNRHPGYNGWVLYIDNKAVTDFVVPDGTEEIGPSVFTNIRLHSVTIPPSVRSVKGTGFFKTLQELNYTGTLTDWCAIRFESPSCNPLSKAKRFIVDGERVSYLQIPEGVTAIGDYQFTDSSMFVGIRLPDSVRSIGERAILCQAPLQVIHIPSGVETIAGNYAYFAKPDALVICSDTADCEAARFAERSGITFRVCDDHAHAHDFAQTSLQPETCTASGKATYQCTVCGETYEETIAETGHLYRQTIREGNCGEPGARIFTCTVCGSTYEDMLPAPGKHEFTERRTEATCGAAGEIFYLCTLCGFTYSETINPTNVHTFTYTDITPATCVSRGVRQFTCTVCGYSYTGPILPTGEHKYDYTILNEATCGAAGKRQCVCMVCGYKYTEAIPATGEHTWTDWTTALEPTPEKEGIRVCVCSVCGETQTKAVPYLPPPEPLTLNSQSLTLVYKQTAVLTASQDVTWHSSDERVVKVDDSGGITAVGTGTAAVTATSTENGQTATCTVTVKYAWWQQLIRIFLFGFLWY